MPIQIQNPDGDLIDATSEQLAAIRAGLGAVSAQQLAAAVETLAPLASPAFTGTPTAPTATTGNSSTRVATTAFVAAAVAPLATQDDLEAMGESVATKASQGALNAVSDAVALKAPLASPALTGTPTAPTAAPGTNSTQVANTEFVAAALSARTEVYQLAMSDLSTALTTGVGKAYFRAPKACTMVGIKLSLFTASSSGSVTVDLLKNGVSVLSTQPAVLATQKTSVTSGVTPVFSTTAVAADDELSLSITGAGTGAKGLIAAIEVAL